MYVHACINTHSQPSTYPFTHIYIHTYIHTPTHTYIHTVRIRDPNVCQNGNTMWKKSYKYIKK